MRAMINASFIEYMLKRIAILLSILILLGGGVWWFWSIGNVTHASEDAEITLHIEHDPVDVRQSGGAWEQAREGMTLQQEDEVRTGKGGRAVVSFYGTAETTLREQTTIELHDATENGGIQTDITLLSGRIWSRVSQLLDLGSTFSVHANDVVATVRGTAFDLLNENGETELWVSESRVELTSTGQANGTIVPEGNKMHRVKGGKWSSVTQMNEDEQSVDWFVRNKKADDVFHDRMMERAKIRLKDGSASVPSMLSRLVEASESMHLKMAKKKKPELFAGIMGRRLFQIKKLIDDGKTGLALQDFSRLEKEVRNQIQGEGGEAYRTGVVKVLSDVQIMLGDAKLTDSLFRLKQRVEDFQSELAGTDDMKQFMHQREIESRLKEAVLLMREGALEEASLSLLAAEQGIVNAGRSLRLIETAKTETKRTLASYLRALDAHAVSLRDALTVKSMEGSLDLRDDAQSATSADAVVTGTVTSTSKDISVLKPVVTSTSAVPTAPVEQVTVLLLRITPANGVTTLLAGGSSSMIVTVIYSNGTSKNVTPNVTWTSSNVSAGVVEGGVFVTTPNSVGSATVTASYTENKETVGEAIVFTVNPPPLR